MAGATLRPGRCEPQVTVGATEVGVGGFFVPPRNALVHCAVAAGAFETSGASGTFFVVPSGATRTSQAFVMSLCSGWFACTRNAP